MARDGGVSPLLDLARKPTGVVIAYASAGAVNALFADSLTAFLLHDHHRGGAKVLRHGGITSMVSGPRIANARTDLTLSFLNHPSGAEWLWMLDSDMVFAADTLDRLLAAANATERPIVGGLCFAGGHGGRVYPTLYVLNGNGHEMDRINDYPSDTLVKVDATGAACVLIHRSVFERLAAKFPPPYPWWEETVIEGNQFGEDITFFLRCASLGIPVHVHTGVRLGHVKASVIDEAAYDRYRADVADGTHHHPLEAIHGAMVKAV